jgi:hypothetical protein
VLNLDDGYAHDPADLVWIEGAVGRFHAALQAGLAPLGGRVPGLA